MNRVRADRRFKRRIKGNDLRLLGELAEFQHDWLNGGPIFPSEGTLSRRTGMGRNTIARARKRLVTLGLLQVEKRRARTGRPCWHYRLVLPEPVNKTARYHEDDAPLARPDTEGGERCAETARYPVQPACMKGPPMPVDSEKHGPGTHKPHALAGRHARRKRDGALGVIVEDTKGYTKGLWFDMSIADFQVYRAEEVELLPQGKE